jgi:hypothetical protein
LVPLMPAKRNHADARKREPRIGCLGLSLAHAPSCATSPNDSESCLSIDRWEPHSSFTWQVSEMQGKDSLRITGSFGSQAGSRASRRVPSNG